MDKTIFTVYWMYKNLVPNALQFEDMGKALSWMKSLRDRPKIELLTAITMCSENINQVGKMGVDFVVDGKTPDGVDYDWNKNSRIGAVKRSERIVKLPSTNNTEVNLDDE